MTRMVPWKIKQRGRVERSLLRHPASSGRCREAAEEILPVAIEVDSGAARIRLSPRGSPKARFLVLRTPIPNAYPWQDHDTVQVVEHFVDALTSASGFDASSYVERFFRYADQIALEVVR